MKALQLCVYVLVDDDDGTHAHMHRFVSVFHDPSLKQMLTSEGGD